MFNIYLLNAHPRCSPESLTKSSLLTFITLSQVVSYTILPKLQVWQQSLIFSSLYIPNALVNFLIVLKRFLFCFVGSQFEGKSPSCKGRHGSGSGSSGHIAYTVRQQGEMDPVLSLLPAFHSAWDPGPQDWRCPQLEWVFPLQLTWSRNSTVVPGDLSAKWLESLASWQLIWAFTPKKAAKWNPGLVGWTWENWRVGRNNDGTIIIYD